MVAARVGFLHVGQMPRLRTEVHYLLNIDEKAPPGPQRNRRTTEKICEFLCFYSCIIVRFSTKIGRTRVGFLHVRQMPRLRTNGHCLLNIDEKASLDSERNQPTVGKIM